jgi:hypothetical protein
MSDGTVNETALCAAVRDKGQGEPCPSCRRPLPIRAKKPEEVAVNWECDNCHAPMTGVLLKDLAAKTADAIRFGRAHFDTMGVPPIPQPMRQLVKEFAESRRKITPGDERRKMARVPVELDVIILLLDENWIPRSKPHLGIGIDLTPHGIGVVTTSPVNATFVAIEFHLPTGVAQIGCQVVWTKDIGHGFFNSGLQFLLRFGRSPTNGAPAATPPPTS